MRVFTDEDELRRVFRAHPNAGVGLLLGLSREGGVGPVDLEVDDPETAAKSLTAIFGADGPPTTTGWKSTRGEHRIYALYPEDAQRLIEAGITQGILSGHDHPCLSGLELRLGTTNIADPRYVQSVVPPTRTRTKAGELSERRRYINTNHGILRLPGILIDYVIEHLEKPRVTSPLRYEAIPREELSGLSPLEKIMYALDRLQIDYTTTDRGIVSRCPNHQGRKRNLNVDVTEAGTGRVLIHCHRGTCDYDAILDAMGLLPQDLYPARYRCPVRPRSRRRSSFLVTQERSSIELVTEAESEAWAEEQDRYFTSLRARPDLRKRLSRRLRLPEEILESLEFGIRERNPYVGEDGDWHDLGPAWTWPECDHHQRVVCIMRRFVDKQLSPKKKIIGSRRDDVDQKSMITHRAARGLVIPSGFAKRPGPVFVVEGESDVLALTHLGAAAVGRPGARAGLREVAKLLLKDPREVIVLGENDQQPDGSWPGDPLPVAKILAELLKRRVAHQLPGSSFKDIREEVAHEIKHKRER